MAKRKAELHNKIAVLLLLPTCSPGYKHVLPTESPMARVAKVVWAALKNR